MYYLVKVSSAQKAPNAKCKEALEYITRMLDRVLLRDSYTLELIIQAIDAYLHKLNQRLPGTRTLVVNKYDPRYTEDIVCFVQQQPAKSDSEFKIRICYDSAYDLIDRHQVFKWTEEFRGSGPSLFDNNDKGGV